MSRNVCTNRSSIFLMSLEKKPIAVRPLLVSEFAGANAGAAFGVTGPLVERGRACAVPPRAELTAAARLFRSPPRGALRDDLACPAGVAIQIHRCHLGPLELFCSFFLAGRRFHSVCFLFSFCMHSCTITPSVQHVCMHTVSPQLHGTSHASPRLLRRGGDAEVRLVSLLRRNSNHPRSEGCRGGRRPEVCLG